MPTLHVRELSRRDVLLLKSVNRAVVIFRGLWCEIVAGGGILWLTLTPEPLSAWNSLSAELYFLFLRWDPLDLLLMIN